ncbi:hypothetical protein I5M32_13925 [Pedobacter sp. SD-b]|uniref:beta-galactosidase n=1 Tax=Pedobacter segetis TaxID=2793069 RepID=A0ABS1BMD6_9SPHI|nr:glycoside hydrolase family 2 TIM barrel-domain containing protein [Pedobacter segetis]MBK0384063.1 hypothetical protein [Pedobacter segetis]
MLIVFTTLSSDAQQRQYLSGKGPSDAVNWDFKITAGRNSGYWTSIPVPSNWELQGFGYYTYQTDDQDYKTNPEIGFYKHTFSLPDTKNKYVRLVFDGSMTDTKVTINGKPAGEVHQGGVTQFSYNISDLVKEGENLIEVEVSKPSKNTSIERSERSADFWLFGGIFRPVYIDILPVSHIERIALNAKMDGSLKIDAFLNQAQSGQSLTAQVYTIDGKAIGKPFSIKMGSSLESAALQSKISNVKAWSPEFPSLYNLKLSLMQGGKTIHTIMQRFGFRTFEVRDHDGFYLNGKRILLKGASMHSFRPKTGRSLNPSDNLSDVRMMKDLNFNTVRTPCYPPDVHFLDLCDSIGLMVLDELPGWSSPLKTDIGNVLVKELVIRDVNHPSVVMWGNGNHRAHNAELEDAFLKWDIQQRRPYKNAAKTEPWPGKNPGRFPLINTQYYPTYAELTSRLASDEIVMPNETLHALYDGGGGAGLADYWKAIEDSKIGGGLIIWALYDEGIIRTDEGGRIDNQGNKAPDGIVGPNQEKKGSYNAVKEIWSPVQITTEKLGSTFNGKIDLINKYTFTNLKQCTFEWKYIRFAAPMEASDGYRTLKKGNLIGPDVAPGKNGVLQIPTFADLKQMDALEITAIDPYGQQLWTWRLLPEDKRDYLARFLPNSEGQIVKQDSTDKWLFKSGNVKFKFSENKLGPVAIQVDSTLFPISGIPQIVAEADSGIYDVKPATWHQPTLKKQGGNMVISYQNINGFNNLIWTVMPNGILKLDYDFTLPKGKYYYAGVGFDLPEIAVKSKRWLGEGPYRVYKNRLQGTSMNVWEVNKKENIPGNVYNFPEFEGYFGKWFWARLNLFNNHTIGMATEDDLYLGLLKPNEGKQPENAAIHYPKNSGVYFFNYLTPIGEKWKTPEEIGPAGQLNQINQDLKGTVYLNFYGDKGNAINGYNVEIE